MRLKEYAERNGIAYETAWKHWKEGWVDGKKTRNGAVIVKGLTKEIHIGRPLKWTKETLVRQVYKLCKGRYVKACKFPPYLYELCIQFFGSVRAAKWEAKIIHGESWTYEKFVKCVHQYCRKRYREEKDWPSNMKVLARQYCGSVRKAKWESGIIQDRRK